MSILDEILVTKRAEVVSRSRVETFDEVRRRALTVEPRSLRSALMKSVFPAVIAEIKRASPSRGLIRPDLDPVMTATQYRAAGAAGVSVLTDEKYFQGDLRYLSAIRAAVPEVPLLRKDFIIDPWQIWESRASGADAVLLIACGLTEAEFVTLLNEAVVAKLDVLIEFHEPLEVVQFFENILAHVSTEILSHLIFGVNNRNLKTFDVSLDVSRTIFPLLDRMLAQVGSPSKSSMLPRVSESGIFTEQDIVRLAGYGASAFLIGEALVAHGDPGENLKLLRQQAQSRHG